MSDFKHAIICFIEFTEITELQFCEVLKEKLINLNQEFSNNRFTWRSSIRNTWQEFEGI
jgi:hypothetical protein